jgi:hypothetical protein
MNSRGREAKNQVPQTTAAKPADPMKLVAMLSVISHVVETLKQRISGHNHVGQCRDVQLFAAVERPYIRISAVR